MHGLGDQSALVAGFRAGFLLAAALCLLGVLAAGVGGCRRPQPPVPAAAGDVPAVDR